MLKTAIKKIIPDFMKPVVKKILSFSRSHNSKVSGDYHIIRDPNRELLKKQFMNAWKDSAIPEQQLKITREQIDRYKNVGHMKALVDLIKITGINSPSVLEIGCSTGYFSAIFKKAGLNVNYEGCDYSSEFIRKAKELHPDTTFEICDATSLPYEDNYYDIAISGCCILHIIDYEKAITETARVAKNFAIFQRTPILHTRQTSFMQKRGYGVPMIEIFFNEEELFYLFRQNKLSVVAVNTHGQSRINGIEEPIFMKSYLCKKNVY